MYYDSHQVALFVYPNRTEMSTDLLTPTGYITVILMIMLANSPDGSG